MGRTSRLAGVVETVVGILRPGESTLERTVTSGVWLSLLTVTDRVVRLGLYLVLARLLAPAEFGLLGLGMVALTVLRRVSRLGLDEALIQREDDDVDAYLDTTWTLTVGRGLALAAVASLAAPLVAEFFAEPRLTGVVRALGVVPLLDGLRNPGVVYFRKRLAFHRQFVYVVSGTVAYACTALAAAVVLGNVWALVVGAVAGPAVRTLVSHRIHGYRPGLGFDTDAARELLGFGKWIFGSGVVLLALNQGDDALVGWLLGSSAVGLYGMAFRLSNAPATEVSHVVSEVTFPAFSQVRDDAAELRAGFFRTVRVVAALALPMAVGIAAVAPVFVRAVLGPAWTPMIHAMRVLAVWGAFRALVAAVGPLFKAVGHPEYSTLLQVSRLVVVAVLIYPATTAWGITGTAAVLVASAVLQNPIAFAVALRAVDARPRRLLRALSAPCLAAALMGTVVLLANAALSPLPGLARLCCLIIIGVATYASAIGAATRVWGTGLADDVAVLRRSLV
ncbi:lipopolysaccharide biosynthesis protein [Halomicrobium salinisoli]|uniref:lipopolysaccharide biosynthesis protein n=1 Tax=Halomicrobium salinisoli TaxID=2878391 RepID=UPI001CF0BDCC|nr:lipopolysaccharide biosynthesis protein [Halomicrobium salinisoli]